jgi:hypothetical protein
MVVKVVCARVSIYRDVQPITMVYETTWDIDAQNLLVRSDQDQPRHVVVVAEAASTSCAKFGGKFGGGAL